LAHHKSNLAKTGPSLAFEIIEGRFRWAGLSDLKADDLLASRDPAGVAPRQEAEGFLHDVLSEGPVASCEIDRQAQGLGINRSTLFRAKRDLGVVVERVGGIGGRGRWRWRLPKAATTPKSATVPNREVGTLSSETRAESVSGLPTDQGGTLSSWREDPAVEVEIKAWGQGDWDSFEGHVARLRDEGLLRDEAEESAYVLIARGRSARRDAHEHRRSEPPA